MRHFVAALLCLLVVAFPAHAQLAGVVRLGGEYGGDELIQFRYSDGTTPEMTAGGGLLLTGGGRLTITPLLDAQLMAGIKYRTIPEATNQSANWLRFPVEATVGVTTPFGVRASGGALVHLANKLRADGEAANTALEFETKPGFLGQLEFVFSGGMSVDVRYTLLEYTIADTAETVDASSIGVGFSFIFGRR